MNFPLSRYLLTPLLLTLLVTSCKSVSGTMATPAADRDSIYLRADLRDSRIIWGDEFNADSLDRSVWNIEINGSGCGNNELEYYLDTPDNVCLKDGNLLLTACRRQYKDKPFTSGRVNTCGKKAFTYGVVVAHIRLPRTANGLWPAFWMMGDDIRINPWPRCGEIDILEMGHSDGISAGTQDRLFNGAIHYGTDSHIQKAGVLTSPYSLQDGKYHTFYCYRSPHRIAMYVDDIPTPYIDIDISNTEDLEHPGYYFHKPHFILFNLAVGGDFTGIHDADRITADLEKDATMAIDFIRVYSLPEDFDKR